MAKTSRLAEQTTQPRLPIGYLFHGSEVIMFSQCENVKGVQGQSCKRRVR